MYIANRIFSLLFLLGVAIAGIAWILGATSLRDRALMVAGLGLAGLVGLPFLAQWLASFGLDFGLVAGHESRATHVLACASVACGHLAFALWLLTHRLRRGRAQEDARERSRALSRERHRLAPPDDEGEAS